MDMEFGQYDNKDWGKCPNTCIMSDVTGLAQVCGVFLLISVGCSFYVKRCKIVCIVNLAQIWVSMNSLEEAVELPVSTVQLRLKAK